ncbi:IgGFc-binding protein [Ostreibacterium oceani]|uniref:IgGFc-binding protein N-terminal domain-containing protein n=1 Tax=Ostreibacterium oceani TaxID=2654998 RepID=A0A6N7EYL3_9GAMM|nr:IgGFc-binding protein [Ostreibacterium oceani]MPV86645.1 hypothetical protein [Ostreibacterium oceani]
MNIKSKLVILGLVATTWLGTVKADFIAVAHRNFDAGAVGSLFIFGAEGVTGTISSLDGGMDQSFTIPAGGVLQVPVNQIRFFQSAEVDSTLGRALLISSVDPISGYMLNRRTATTDMSFLLDIPGLGTTYRLATYNVQGNLNTQFSITAVNDNTTVTITPTAALTSGQPADTPFSRTLNAGESFYFESAQDLTGSLVTADNPVAVFSGNVCANVPTGVSACDHLFSQLPPVNNFADTFVIPETALTGSVGDIVRVVAHEDNTDVTINGTLVATLMAGEFYEHDATSDTVIETSSPVLTMQYLKGKGATGNGDPAMSFMPGANQLLDTYVFSTPTGTAVFDQNFLNIAIPDSALGSLVLNGVSVDTSGFAPIGTSGFSSGNIAIPAGVGEIEASAPFVLSISGYSQADSYLTLVGTTFSSGASPEPPSGAVRPVPATSWSFMLLALFVFAKIAALQLKRYPQLK